MKENIWWWCSCCSFVKDFYTIRTSSFLKVLLLFLFLLPGLNYSFNLEPKLPIIKRGEEGSYFGFSVAQHIEQIEQNKYKSWILVGAPLGKNLQPSTTQSGALFKCPLNLYERNCTQVVTDGKRKPPKESFEQNINSDILYEPSFEDEDKEGQWLGVNVRSQGKNGKVMVCAHRYVHRGPDFRWGLGLCHFLDQHLKHYKTHEPCRDNFHNGLLTNGFCQVGTSGAMLEDNMALMGAPGAFTCRGTLYGMSVSENYFTRDRTRYHSPIGVEASVDKYSYLGMSSTGGKFFGNEYSYATGAPRAANGSGQVLFFSKIMKKEKLQEEGTLTGEGFASSFGYELASLDLNGDNYTDIVVGAPFYMDPKLGGDCGAAYIYINNGHGFSSTYSARLTGPPDSRFGFALSTVGDINHDGYEDLAIGAPYEDRGVVYIYLGSANGIIQEPSQVIRASKYFPDLRTFGYSLSGGIDLDENSYPDLLIGAFESSAIVLLRARPIIDMVTEVFGNFTSIDPSSSGCPDDPETDKVCFSFDACFEIREAAKLGVASLGVNYKLEAETFLPGKKWSRVYFEDGSENQSHIVEKLIRVRQQSGKQCKSEIVYLKKPTKDIQTPVSFKLTYTLEQEDPAYIPNIDGLPIIQNYPILNQQEASKVFQATFEKDCGLNDICESDLYVSASTDLPQDESSRYTLVLGTPEFKLNISVSNLGEPAYEAILYIEHPKSMSFKAQVLNGTNFGCSPYNSTIVSCQLGNPYKKRGFEDFTIRFDTSGLKDIETRVDFIIWANSTSVEFEKMNDNFTLPVTVIKVTELEIRGQGEPSNVPYGGEIKGESAMRSFSDVGLKVVHTYEIINHGPSRASNFNVELYWPIQVGHNNSWPGPGKWLLYLERWPEINAGGNCSRPSDVVNVLNLTEPFPSNPKNLPVEASASKLFQPYSRSKRESETIVAPEIIVKDGKKSKVVNMDCLRGSAICVKFDCIIRSLFPNESVEIKIHSRLWNSTLVEDYPSVDQVRIYSRAQIRFADSVRQDPANDVATASTICYPELKLKVDAEGVEWWVYLLAGILGILLLLAIIYCLYKWGFFIRRRPQQPTHTAHVHHKS